MNSSLIENHVPAIDLCNADHGSSIRDTWPLPSDHLPIAMEIGGVNLVSWNVLNSLYIDYVKRDQEGLADSQLVTDDVPDVDFKDLTKRERNVVELVRTITEKADVVMLQECGAVFIEHVTKILPHGYQLIRGSPVGSKNDCCVILNTNKLELVAEQSTIEPRGYACKANTPILSLLLSSPDSVLRLIHTHVPGDPALPGVAQLATFLAPVLQSEKVITIVSGDLNFSEEFIRVVFASENLPQFNAINKSNTVIGTDRVPKRIDHFLVFGEGYQACSLDFSYLSPEVMAAARILNPQ